jgi:hypothetical protein
MVKVRILLQFLKNSNLLGEIFRVGVIVEFLVGSSTKPIRFRPQLIREIFVIIGILTLFYELFSISGLAAEREIASGMLISRLHILIVSPITWKL